MFSYDEIVALRQAAEHPEQPLVGRLVVTNSDTYCDWCRGQGRDEAACDLSATDAGTYVVLGPGTYHVDCARELGWTPTEKEADYLARYPKGPYA